MTIEVDTSAFNAMCDEIARMADAPPDEALREEAGAILSRAIELTPAADVSKIKEHEQRALFTLQPATIYAPKRPNRRRLVNGRVLYKLSQHYPDQLWTSITAARAKDLQKKLGARGLAKQSWWKLGQLLGLNVQAPAYVQRATASTGREYPADEKAQVVRQTGEIAYEIENAQPTINAINGANILQRAIDGRVKFFLTNIAHDVFDKLTDIAKKYPGITIT